MRRSYDAGGNGLAKLRALDEDRSGVLAGDGLTQEVEMLRQAYTTPDAPYTASPELIQRLLAIEAISKGYQLSN